MSSARVSGMGGAAGGRRETARLGAGVLVDANVLIDVATDDPRWSDWSARALEEAGRERRLILSPIVYAEVSIAFERIEDLGALLPPAVFHREALPWEAAFLAHRRRGGTRMTPLPDFLIGAHAAVRGHALLTRDRGRFATYFPSVELIEPERDAGGVT